MRSRAGRVGIAAVLAIQWLALAGVTPTAAQSVAVAAQMLFRLHDARLNEVSGAAVGIRSPDVLYVHNDSGDRARFFALDARTGDVRAQFTVPGAVNVDWEDIAVARDARGVPSVWIADIGDNDATRSSVRIYRVDEPLVTPSMRNASRRTARPQTWRLRYTGGPRNAEGLAVLPGGAAYLFDKVVFGPTTVYSVPQHPSTHVQTVTAIGSFDTRNTGTAGGPNPFGRFTVTGAAASADGTVLAVRTYTDAYLWRLDSGRVDQALLNPPTVLALPAQPQGEGIAVDGQHLISTSEKAGSRVYSIPVPASTVASASSRVVPATTPSSGVQYPASVATAAAASGAQATASVPPASHSRSAAAAWQAFAALGTLTVLIVSGSRLRNRRRRRST